MCLWMRTILWEKIVGLGPALFIQKMLLFCLSVTEYSVFSANFARQIKFDSHYE